MRFARPSPGLTLEDFPADEKVLAMLRANNAAIRYYIYVLDRVLAYEVLEQEVVEPNQTQSLEAILGEDLVTLVTCTPYGVNSHRLLVHGRRTEYVEQTAAEEAEHPTTSVHTRYGLWVACGLGVTAALILLMFLISRRVRRRADGQEEVRE